MGHSPAGRVAAGRVHDSDVPEWQGYDATPQDQREFPDLAPIRPREARARDGRAPGGQPGQSGAAGRHGTGRLRAGGSRPRAVRPASTVPASTVRPVRRPSRRAAGPQAAVSTAAATRAAAADPGRRPGRSSRGRGSRAPARPDQPWPAQSDPAAAAPARQPVPGEPVPGRSAAQTPPASAGREGRRDAVLGRARLRGGVLRALAPARPRLARRAAGGPAQAPPAADRGRRGGRAGHRGDRLPAERRPRRGQPRLRQLRDQLPARRAAAGARPVHHGSRRDAEPVHAGQAQAGRAAAELRRQHRVHLDAGQRADLPGAPGAAAGLLAERARLGERQRHVRRGGRLPVVRERVHLSPGRRAGSRRPR